MTQKKETKASISSEWFQCPCGAMGTGSEELHQ